MLIWPRPKETLRTVKTGFVVAIMREVSVACNEFLLKETVISRSVEANSVPLQKSHHVLRQECSLGLPQIFDVTDCTLPERQV